MAAHFIYIRVHVIDVNFEVLCIPAVQKVYFLTNLSLLYVKCLIVVYDFTF